MRVDEKFNRRSSSLIESQQPLVDNGHQPGHALGVQVRCFEIQGGQGRCLAMHMTPDEAMTFARDLIEAARRRLNR